jgi:hypothetical protein
MKSLLNTAYWPNLHYFFYVLNSESILIEQFENYQKQSFRNRTQILSANGVLDLSIPVRKRNIKELSKDIEIAYSENWQIRHWRAITSAYKNSPYFEHFETDIQRFYTNTYERLLDYNLQQLQLVMGILKLERTISFTAAFEKETALDHDLRDKIHPKLGFREDTRVSHLLQKPYYQTFGDKFGFTPNLSILDLIFNTGLGAITYLVDPRKKIPSF